MELVNKLPLLVRARDALSGYKTYIVTLALVVHAVVIVGWQGGDWNSAFELILGALGLTTLRAGVKKA